MPEYSIAVITNDAQTVQFACSGHEDIISAAERQAIVLPQQCRSGACGFCTTTHVSGAYVLKDYNEAALSAEQRQHKQVLLCRTYPQENLIIHAGYDYSAIKFEQIPQALCTVVSAQMVNEKILHLVLQQPSGDTDLLSATITAGQYVQLSNADKTIRRAYSVANLANWDGILEFYIELRANGLFSAILRQLKATDSILVFGAKGEFILKERGLKPRYFIAGGTGLSPILAMLRQMAEFGEPHPVQLFWGSRYETDVFADNVISELQFLLPKLNYKCCISRPSTNWNGYCGSVMNAVAIAFSNFDMPPDIYACGSARLVDGVIELARKSGVPNDNVFFERFGA